ncbi:hypothetical protein ACRAWD_20955 [Caulobacter segnis]
MAASQPHHFLAVTKEGRAAIATTTGNGDCHLVLRGGKTPNYDAASVAAAARSWPRRELPERIMVDVSHANSGKNHENQPAVVADVCAQLATGALADHGRDDREQPGRRPSGHRPRPTPDLRPVASPTPASIGRPR